MGVWQFFIFLLHVSFLGDFNDFRFFLTIGFGDYAPATEAGRPIFIVYALLAVPTMTIIGIPFLTLTLTSS
jgi:hypothetical protein